MPLAAAVLDVEGEGVAPLQVWREALLGGPPTDGAVASDYDVFIPHGGGPLSSFDAAYWVYCFPHLFPCGDGVAAGAAPTTPGLTLGSAFALAR